MPSRVNYIAKIGLLAAIGLIFSYVESLFPIPIGIPGVKVGISNIVTVVAIYILSPSAAFAVTFIRVLLAGTLFSTGIGIIYSICGAFFSLFIMWILHKSNRFSVIGISAGGGVAHNVSQLLVACITVESFKLLYYLPILLLAGVVAGVVVGVVSKIIVNRLMQVH